LIKRKILLGLSYAVIWYGIVSFIYQFGLEFPVSWSQTILENNTQSDFIKILSIRALWAIEFASYVLWAAIPLSYFVVKFYPVLSLKAVVQISSIAVIALSIMLLAILPRFVPFYFALAYVIICFIFILFGCVKCTQYITNKSWQGREKAAPHI
jgi:hypothetical protein